MTSPWQPETLLAARTSESTMAGSMPRAATPLPTLTEEQQLLLTAHLHRGSTQVIAFIEQLGLTEPRRADVTAWREQLLEQPRDGWPEALIDMAFSPHAPYSTPIEFVGEVAQLANRHHKLLAMHVLESPAERQWLDEGKGPMAEMLERFGAAGWRVEPDYFQKLCAELGRAPAALLIHGNYLTDAELDCVARHRSLSIVYCPRTHARFGHKPYPLESIQQRGIPLLLGTDSRSTNPDLNLWQEARTAVQLHATLRPTQALAAITSTAAEALQLHQSLGTLRPGRLAWLNLIRLTDRSALTTPERLIEHLFETALHPSLLV